MKGCALFAVLMIALLLPAAVTLAATVEVNAGQEVGPLPYLFRAGIFAFGIETGYPASLQKQFFRDLKPGALEGSTIQFLYWTQSFQDLVQRMRSEPEYDAFLKRVEEHGGKVVISLLGMPRWLSSKSSDNKRIESGDLAVWGASPPKDYNQWAEVVHAIVDYYSNTLGLHALYKVWWEPEGPRWQGTEEEFFKLYKYTVIGARRANKHAMVGGPSPAGWETVFWRNRQAGWNEPMLRNFIEYCAKTPVPELGLDRVPIDFLVWHQFQSDPSFGFRRATTAIRGWLKQFGYPENTPTLIGEWSTWRSSGFLSPERDTAYAASYVIAALIGMDRAGITLHSFTSMIEQTPENFQGEFGGDFGIFTKSLVIKPVFNAFRTLSYLQDKRVDVVVRDPFLATVATRGKDGVAILIANFIPEGGMLREAASVMLAAKGHSMQELAGYGLTAERLRQLVEDFRQKRPLDLQGLRVPEPVKRDLDEISAQLRPALARARESVTADLLIRNPPPDATRYERYVIDASHSNSYALRSQVQNWLVAARQAAREKAKQTLRQRGRSAEEIARLEGQARSRGLGAAKEQADPDTRAALTVFQDQLADGIQRINDSPGVGLQKVEERTISPGAEYREALQLTPYSVTLIRLTR